MKGQVFALAALLLIPGWALADDDTGNIAHDAGPFEVTLNAMGSNDREFQNGGFSLEGGVGVFVLPVLELSARDAVSYVGLQQGHSWANEVKGAIDFNLPLDRFEPYIGGNIGYIASDAYRSSPEAAPELGLKIFLSKSAFFFGQAEYDFLWHRGGNTFSTGEFDYTLGIGVRF